DDRLTMGRFATTVALYEELRPPYPPAFFGRVAQQLGLASEHALIDLGTGPGLLALGFAPYVGRIVGVDPEPAMIVAARTAARRAWSKDSLWSEAGRGGRTHRDLAAFFRGTRFHVTEPVMLETSHEISVSDLARRVLTYSSSSPEVLGDRAEAMLSDIAQRLL